jgi:hypothetical protein
MKKTKKIEASLKPWRLQKRSGEYCLVGDILSHPTLVEGETIISSPLLIINFVLMKAETADTIYSLT